MQRVSFTHTHIHTPTHLWSSLFSKFASFEAKFGHLLYIGIAASCHNSWVLTQPKPAKKKKPISFEAKVQLYILIKACVVSPCTSVLSSNRLASNSEVPYTLYLSSPPLTSTTDKGWGLFVFCVNCRCVWENSTSQFTVNLPMFVSVHIYPPACRHGVTGLAACSRCSTLQQMWCLFEVTVPLGFFFSLVTFYLRVAAPPFPFSSSLDCFGFFFHWLFEGMWSDHSSVSALWRTWTKWLVYSHFCSFIAETIHWIYCMIECKKKNLYSCLFYMSNSWYMYVTWF